MFWALFGAIMAWAIFVRCWGVGERAFWSDEAWVASTVRAHTLGELVRQRDLPVPNGFAAATKLGGEIVSPAEWGYRLVPMICGVGLVWLCYVAGRTLRLPRITAMVTMAAIASSPLLGIWSRELKQYEVEAFLTVLLALLVFRLRRQERRGWATITGVMLICGLGPWFGYGVVFSALCLMVMLGVMRPRAGMRRGSMITAVVALAILAVSTLGLWQVAAGAQAENEALKEFAGKWYIKLTDVDSVKKAVTFGSRTTVMAVVPFLEVMKERKHVVPLAFGIWVVALVGMICWPRKGRWELVVWAVVPWLLVFAAAVARAYPFGMWRMMTFCVTPVMMALAVGLVQLLRRICRLLGQRRGYGVVIGLVVVLVPVTYLWRVPIRQGYWAYHDYPAALERLAEERKSGEPVLVPFDAVAGVRYYAGAARDFRYQPTTGGTLASAEDERAELDAMVRDIANTWATRWWIIVSDVRVKEALANHAGKYGYRTISLKCNAGGDPRYGRAQLYLVSKVSRGW